MDSLKIRRAELTDVPAIHRMIGEMAEHVHLPVSRSEAQLAADGFGERPVFEALLAEWDNRPAGYAMFYDCYSSFRGYGIFLEDLFVSEPLRGKGIARALLASVASIAVERNAFGVEFNVLDWNEPAMRFFTNAGAVELIGRKTLCITRDVLRENII